MSRTPLLAVTVRPVPTTSPTAMTGLVNMNAMPRMPFKLSYPQGPSTNTMKTLDFYMRVSINRGPQNEHQNSRSLIVGTPTKGPPNLPSKLQS